MMKPFEVVLQVHFMIGVVALVTFWLAAFARKGSRRHRLVGRIYLLSLMLILLSTLPMMVIRYQQGNYPGVIVLIYLFSLVFTASWVAWRAIRSKKNLQSYNTPFFKALTFGITFFALGILLMGWRLGAPLMMVFSSVGLLLGMSMWPVAIRKKTQASWSLAQHLNGMAVNFAATHGSFFGFGLSRLLSLPDTPELNLVAQSSMIVLALLLRIWLGRYFLKKKRPLSTQLA